MSIKHKVAHSIASNFFSISNRPRVKIILSNLIAFRTPGFYKNPNFYKSNEGFVIVFGDAKILATYSFGSLFVDKLVPLNKAGWKFINDPELSKVKYGYIDSYYDIKELLKKDSIIAELYEEANL